MHGPIGAKVSKPFGAGVLTVLFLQVARGDVVHGGQSKDVLVGAIRPHFERALLDDDAQLGLMVDAPRPERHFDGGARTDDRRGGLDEEQRLGRQRLVLLGRVILVVQTDADDLRRYDRRQQLRALGRDLGAFLEIAENVAAHQPPLALALGDVTGLAFIIDPVQTQHPLLLRDALALLRAL